MNLRINFQARVDPWVKTWWVAFCEREGYTFKGKPHLKGLLTAIALGEYEIKKKSEEALDNP